MYNPYYYNIYTNNCRGCGGRGWIEIHDTPEKAHGEKCPVCNGTGQEYVPSPVTITTTYATNASMQGI